METYQELRGFKKGQTIIIRDKFNKYNNKRAKIQMLFKSQTGEPCAMVGISGTKNIGKGCTVELKNVETPKRR